MNMMFLFSLAIIAFALLAYPAMLLLDHILFGRCYESRVDEFRQLAIKLALVEYTMIASINEARKELGQDQITVQPVAAQFKTTFWSRLCLQAETAVRQGIMHLNKMGEAGK